MNLEASAFDAEVLTDERPESLHRSTELAAEDAEELLRLFVGRALVDEQSQPPVSVGHHLGTVHDGGYGEPANVRAVDVALGHVEDERNPAVVVVGAVVEREVAGAEEVAGAGLDVGAL